MLGEASTIKIARTTYAEGFNKNKDAARQGGMVAGTARKELEKRSRENVSTKDNYLQESESKKRKQLKNGKAKA